ELHLHALAVGKSYAEPFAAADVLLRDLDAALRPAEPAHAVGEPRRAEPHLHHFQTVAEAAEHVVVVHFEAIEFELAMTAVLLRAHDLDAAQDAPAGLVLVKQERGDALPLIVGGARREDEMRGAIGAGDEPFAAVDFPGVAVLLGIGHPHARIGTAAGRRLGHGERRAHLALDDGLE